MANLLMFYAVFLGNYRFDTEMMNNTFDFNPA